MHHIDFHNDYVIMLVDSPDRLRDMLDYRAESNVSGGSAVLMLDIFQDYIVKEERRIEKGAAHMSWILAPDRRQPRPVDQRHDPVAGVVEEKEGPKRARIVVLRLRPGRDSTEAAQ